MSKRPSESSTQPSKHIKPSSGLNEQEDEPDQNGSQVTSQDSGYSGSQWKVVQPMDLEEYSKEGSKADVSNSGYAGPQGQDVQVMNLDESSSCQTVRYPEQGSDGSSPSKGNIQGILGIRVDEDSSQEASTEMMERTDEKSRNFAENVVRCSINIGQDGASKMPKKEKKKKKKEGLDDKDEGNPQDLILMNTCALLNSGGGILRIKIKDFESLPTNSVDKFWQTIEPKLKAMVKSSLRYDEVFDRRVDSDEISLFIKAPQHFCTVEYNLFVAGDSRNYEVAYDQMVELLQKESAQCKKQKSSSVDVPLKDLPTVPKTLRYNEEFSLIESKQIQLKNFTSETYLDSNNRTQCQGISKQISAFANSNGGVIVIGVTDEGKVCGLKINEKNSKEHIEDRVIAIVEKMLRGSNLILQRKVHWDMEFIPVSDSESSAVVVIYVTGMESRGGVFTKCPKSFELRPDVDGRKVPYLLEFKEWKKRMLSGLELQGNSKATEAMISKFDKLTISQGHLLTVKRDVQKIRDAFFSVEDGFPVTPRGFESKLPQKAQDVIKEIQKKCSRDRNRGLVVASHSWPSNSEAGPMEGVICDLLIVSRNLGGLHLLTLCHGDDDVMKFREYSRDVAQTIKTSLVRDGACTQKFYITPHVVPCTGTNEKLVFLRDNRYPPSYDLNVTREKLNDVLKALVIILATVPSTLSNKLGVSIMNLLTKEQFELVHQQIEINRELWIKGAAGTGKTLVAVEFMRELKRREKLSNEEILCVCENAGIRNQIREQDVCEVVCRKTFESRPFPKVRHVVMDEAHNYEDSGEVSPSFGTEAPLYHKARHLVRQRNPNQAGYLWIFTDKCQSNHNFPSGMPNEIQQKPQFRLKKVIRNSRKIFDHAKKFLTEGGVGDTLEIGHDFDGERVKFIDYPVREKSQQVVVNETIESLLSDGYENKDIAILFPKKDDHIPTGPNPYPFVIRTAEENNSDHVVVSSVLKYSGLERPVVVLVDIEDYIPRRRRRDPFIYCGVTRAMVKLVIIRGKQRIT